MPTQIKVFVVSLLAVILLGIWSYAVNIYTHMAMHLRSSYPADYKHMLPGGWFITLMGSGTMSWWAWKAYKDLARFPDVEIAHRATILKRLFLIIPFCSIVIGIAIVTILLSGK